MSDRALSALFVDGDQYPPAFEYVVRVYVTSTKTTAVRLIRCWCGQKLDRTWCYFGHEDVIPRPERADRWCGGGVLEFRTSPVVLCNFFGDKNRPGARNFVYSLCNMLFVNGSVVT